ncbi:CMRF35-like molecule 1 [Mastacembelus armatus]|uniref:CMRF35-like molecule 1 n=1 Tax=Mastacembelus armatus TaxID=205130 RepID=UPI000E4632D5|nr:CMRF35-like molecule 1 [Mastacembelus armatus]
MRNVLFLSMWLFSANTGQDPVISLSAQEGGHAQITCPYQSGYEQYPKYVSKGRYADRKTIIKVTSGKRSEQKGKYYIFDDTMKRTLHVTIHDLTLNDGGTYWCEIDTYGFDPKTEIQLKVNNAPFKPPRVHTNPPVKSTVHVITTNQQQPPRTTESSSETTLWSTQPDDMQTGLHMPLFLTVVMCVVAMLFVCLFTLCLLLAVKQQSLSPHQKRESSSDYENMKPGVLREPDSCCSCSAPDSTDLSALPSPPPDFCSHFTSKCRESTVTLGIGEYVDVDVPGHNCQYQQLDTSRLEEHVYHSLHGNSSPKDGSHRVKDQSN